eukprot:TRINITY_DN95957_c0_g1_i1.p1 TRINITY_DN95957_c0_g1~~TRINITY_DN95957_c0_g1_i1.p1  ORF type:complete len:555 (+),score=80.36 TRINITY_DN95957_c0_g1_i1:30-1694(+)
MTSMAPHALWKSGSLLCGAGIAAHSPLPGSGRRHSPVNGSGRPELENSRRQEEVQALRLAAAAAAACAAQCSRASASRSPTWQRLWRWRERPTTLAACARDAGKNTGAGRFALSWTGLDSEILRVWLPAVANLILLPLVGAVDLFWVASLGDPLAVAGMGAANQVYNTIYFCISFLPAVVTPRIAKEFAVGNTPGAAAFIGEALALALVLGAFGSIVLLAYPTEVLSLVTSSPAVLATARPYLRVRGLSLIATLWSTVSFATFRGLLDFTTPLKVSLFANLVNVLLDPIFMFSCGLGATGAATATCVAELLSIGGFLTLLCRRGLVRSLPKLPPRKQLASLLQSGLAVQVRSVATNAIFLTAVRTVTAIDPSGIQAAAYQVTIQFWNLAGFVSLGLSTAGSGLVPTELWRDGVSAARRAADRLQVWGWGLGLVLGALQLLALPLIGLMTPNEAVRRAARVPGMLAAALQVINGATFAGEGMLLGLRAYRWLAASSALGCLAMISIIYLSGQHALTGVWIGFFAFNLSRLCGSMMHRYRFGPLARRNADSFADSQ